jgi:hypothetical protein
MKALKISAFVLGGLTLLTVIAVALALNSGVQTWAVRKALAGQPGLALTVDRVSAGTSSAQITGLRIEQDGTLLSADEITAAYSAWDYLTGGLIVVDSAALKGLTLDLRSAPAAITTPAGNPPATPTTVTAPAAPAVTTPGTPPAQPFAGIFTLLQLPVDVRVGRVSADGKALLPGNQSATFAVEGKDIAAGQSGELSWKLDFTDAGTDVPVASAQLTGTATVRITADRRIDRIELTTTASARGPGLPTDSVHVALTAAQPAVAGNESFQARVGLLRGTAVEPLLATDVDYLATSRTFAGTWNVTIGAGQLDALLSGLGLPDFTARGAGKFTFEPTTGNLATDGSLEADVTNLGTVSPALAAVGGLKVRTAFDARLAGEVARLEKLELTATDANGRTLAEITALQPVSFNTRTQLVALANPNAPLARVSVQALPLAWAQSFISPVVIDSGELSLVLGVEAAADGSRVAVRTIEPVTLRNVTLRDGENRLVDQASFTVSPRIDYTADRVEAELAGLAIVLSPGDRIEGTVTAQVATLSTTPAVTFTTRLNGRLADAFKPYLPLDPGPLTFAHESAGTLAGNELQLTTLAFTVNREAGAALLGVTLVQPLRVNTGSMAISTAQPNAAAVRVQLGEVPLVWGQAFVADSALSGALTGGTIDLSFRGRRDLAAVTSAPITLRGISATIGGDALANAVDVNLDLAASFRDLMLSYDLRQLELKEGDANIATLRVAGTVGEGLGAAITITGKGTLTADLPAALRQPALAPFATLSRGTLAVAFDASAGQTIALKATVSAKDLVARQGNRALGSIEAAADVALDPAGSGKVKLPLVVTVGNRKSDVTLDGTVAKSGEAYRFDGKLTGEQIILDDLQALAALAPAATPAAATPTATPATRPAPTTAPRGSIPANPPARSPTPAATAAAAAARDTVPFWQGVTGRFELDVKRVQYGQDYPISGLRGALAITENRLAVETLEGRLKENPFKFAGGLTFAAQQPKPYSLTGTANVTNFDIGEFLRASNPSERPALETKATVAAKLGGSGLNLNDLLTQATGEFELTGAKGVLRALGRKGQAVSAASTVLGIVGAMRGSDTTVAVAELASALNELAFDQFKLRVERSATLDFKVTSLEFLSPTARITGSGGITYQAGVPIQSQPLRFDLMLAGKDNLAFLLNRAGVLGTTQDAQGYYQMNSGISLGGTAAKPDSTALWRMIGQAAIGGLLR